MGPIMALKFQSIQYNLTVALVWNLDYFLYIFNAVKAFDVVSNTAALF
jgi:hypothetical protein